MIFARYGRKVRLFRPEARERRKLLEKLPVAERELPGKFPMCAVEKGCKTVCLWLSLRWRADG